MEAALADAGEVAASLPRDFVPQSFALKLKMRLEDPNEVFQQWEHPEEEDEHEEESSRRKGTRGCGAGGGTRRASPSLHAATSLGGGVGGGESRGGTPATLCPNNAEIQGYDPMWFYGLTAFDLDEESTVQPSRHTAPCTTELVWSANILSIKVLSSTMGYPVNLYGSVYVRDDLDRKRVYLFRRHRDNAQLIKSPEETLALTGPSRGLVIFDNLFFEIDLKMKCDGEVDGMNFSQGSRHYSHVYKMSRLIKYRSHLLEDELSTEVSNVELRYAPVRRAVEAIVQIKAQEGFTRRERVSSLCGKVTAFVTDISEEILLFDSEASGTMMNIREDGSFELWRSVISVPIDGSLTLRVETWEGNSKANFSSCSRTLTPQICDEDIAPCALHAILIKAAWSPLYIPEFDAGKDAF